MLNSKNLLFLALAATTLLITARRAYSDEGYPTDGNICQDFHGHETGCWDQLCASGGNVFYPRQGYDVDETSTCCYYQDGSTSATSKPPVTSSGACCTVPADAPPMPAIYCYPASTSPAN